ncbi:MAG: portal protein [Bacillota bacterium]|nr:portal protein [Bacillota bacterium]
MERTPDDLKSLDPEEINEMEELRIDELNKAGIDEGDVLDKANKDLNTWQSYFNENIVRGKDDMNFVLRDQWTAVERSEFTRLFKPAMTFNKLYDATKKIVGEQRKNKPDLIVRSLTGKATQEQINLRADLVRTISYQSQNDLVYQTAFKSALMMGYGAFQVCLDYEAPKSFNRIIRYDIVTDPTMCSWDPTATKPHKGDGNWCSRRYIFTRDEFFATYPYVVNPISFVDPYMLLDFQWQTRDTICICDQFKKEWFPLIIYKLSNGEVVTDYEWEKREKKFEDNREFVKDNIIGEIIAREIPTIVDRRQTQDYKIMHYRMIRDMIIDFSEWPSRQLPIPFVDGDSYYVEGRQYTKSFIHEARDAQKSLNYARSEQMAELKNRRREQWIATPDNIIGYEQQWRNPELQMGALMAKPDPKTGQMPIKSPAWEISQGLFVAAQSSTQDLREILGFSENEQMQGRDISGKARRERKMEGSMSSYVFFDNLNQAIEQGGRIVNDLLPYVIGEDERHMMVSRKNGQSEAVVLNQKMGEKVVNEVNGGEYDVEIDTGPSFAVQKDTALEFLAQTIQAFPQAFPLIADLWAANLDVQFMPLIKERLKNLVPPDILAKEEGKEPPPKQPNPEQMMMQMQMEEKKAEIQNKMQKLQLDAERLKLEHAELLLKAQQIQSDTQLNIYDHELNLEKARVTHGLDHKNSEQNFNAQIAKILADIHRDEMKAEKSKNTP